MPLQVAVISRPPTAGKFWDVMLRIVPRALAGTAARMAATAPHGKTGKLSRRVDVRVRRINQGLVQGVQADFVVGVRYGHLVVRGHRNIPRGPGRRGANKGVLRSALKARRSAGATGFTPGNPFADQAFTQSRSAVIATIERMLAQEVK